jgi:hypothetical protein
MKSQNGIFWMVLGHSSPSAPESIPVDCTMFYLSLGGSEFQSTVRRQHKKKFKHNKERWHVLLLNRRTCRTMLCGSISTMQGRKTCARRQEKHAPDRAWWQQVFSISPQRRAKFCTGLQRKKTAAQLTTEDHSFGSSLPSTGTATILPLEPCALNAEIQHFILRFNKISLFYGYHSKRG